MKEKSRAGGLLGTCSKQLRMPLVKRATWYGDEIDYFEHDADPGIPVSRRGRFR